MPRYKHGSGSVYLRGKTWWIAYYTPDGKQVCESAKTRDKAEARKKLQIRLGELAGDRYVGLAVERVTFAELAQGLITDYEVNGRKDVRMLKSRLKNHLAPFFTGKTAHGITTTDVKAFIAKRQEERASNGAINRELAALKRAFNIALQEGKITKKPYIQRLEEHNVRQGFFESWEFTAILAKLPDYLRSPLTFAYYTGWRVQSEILPLTWDRIDLEAGTVRLYRGTTKNKDGRIIALPRVLREVLEQQWQEHLVHSPACPYVFPKDGERLRTFYKAWRRACKDAGLSGKLSHDFRRTAVRNLVRAGVPERVAMMVTGHKTRDVFDRYNIVSAGDLEEAARRIDGMIATQTTTSLTTSPVEPATQPLLSH